MNIQGLEKISMVDYPNKIATTVFTGGCNFRCPFCHNAGIVEKRYNSFDEDEIINYLLSRKKIIDGVVVSGGEPTLQPDLVEFIEKIKNMNFLVKLDTNGSNPIILKKLLDKNLLDYVAMDIKNNFDDYGEITGICGINVQNIKDSLNILKNSTVEYELRTTLVDEYHKETNILKMAADLVGHKKIYLQKFVDSGECICGGLREVSKECALKYANILSEKIENVFLRGY